MNKIASIDAALTRCIQDMQMSLSILAISMQTMTYDEMQWWRAMRELWVAALGGPEVCKAMPRKFKLSTVVLIDIAAVQLIPYECFSI